MANRIQSRLPAVNIEQGFEAALSALLDRTWRAIESPVLPSADHGLRLLEVEGIRLRESLRVAMPVEVTCPLPAGEREAERGIERALTGTEAIARSMQARVLLSEKPLLPIGVKNALAFEQAFLVTLLGSLKTVEKSDGRDLGRLSLVIWEHGLPLTHVETTDDRAITVVAARPDPYLPGRGLGLAMVEHAVRSPDAAEDEVGVYRIHFHLIVPKLKVGEHCRRVFGMEVSAER